MALDLGSFRIAATAARRVAPFAVAALVGLSGIPGEPAHAEKAKPEWTALKTAKPDFAAAEKTLIPTRHCNYLFDRLTDAMEESGKGKDYVSKTTRKSLAAFYSFNEKRLPTCTGPREIAWEPERARDHAAHFGHADILRPARRAGSGQLQGAEGVPVVWRPARAAMFRTQAHGPASNSWTTARGVLP